MPICQTCLPRSFPESVEFQPLTLHDKDGDNEPGDGGAHPAVEVVLVKAVEDDEVGVGEERQDLRRG